MLPSNLSDIKLSHFKNLVENKYAEQRKIEYKRELNLKDDKKKSEFLADVSSFSNANGGDLIIGIPEKEGMPESLTGVEENPDQYIRRLESIIRDGIKPRVAVEIRSYEVSDNMSLFLIRIPKSLSSPHQVTFNNTDKFYTRSSNGKYQMDVLELRSAFAMRESIDERIRNFRLDRISKILANDTPLPLLTNPKIVLQIIPISSFEPGKVYEIVKYKNSDGGLVPLGGGNWDNDYNLDGIISFGSFEHPRSRGEKKSYVQLYKNGIIETVESSFLAPVNGRLEIKCTNRENYEEEIVDSFKKYLTILEGLQVSPPIFVFLTLLNVKGYSILFDGKLPRLSYETWIDRDVLNIPEILIEKFDANPETALKPLFDAVWNACGYERSYNYDSWGYWRK